MLFLSGYFYWWLVYTAWKSPVGSDDPLEDEL